MGKREKKMEDKFLSEVHLDLKSSVVEESKPIVLTKQKFVTRIPILMDLFETLDNNVDEKERENRNVKNSTDVSSDLDDDGDFEINQNNPKTKTATMLTFVHCKETNLSDVGLQIWRASLYLLDFIFSSVDDFNNSHCIELGCGIGVCSSILQMKVKCLIATDKEENILELCLENMKLQLENSTFVENTKTLSKSNGNCRLLDWFEISKIYDRLDSPDRNSLISYFESKFPQNQEELLDRLTFNWSQQDISNLKRTNRIIAADCIYDEALTIAFLKTILSLCLISEEKEIRIFIAVEKRLNFTFEDLDVTSPCYNHFIKLLTHLELHNNLNDCWKIDGLFKFKQSEPFGQFLYYERTNLLELWEITFTRVKEEN